MQNWKINQSMGRVCLWTESKIDCMVDYLKEQMPDKRKIITARGANIGISLGDMHRDRVVMVIVLCLLLVGVILFLRLYTIKQAKCFKCHDQNGHVKEHCEDCSEK